MKAAPSQLAPFFICMQMFNTTGQNPTTTFNHARDVVVSFYCTPLVVLRPHPLSTCSTLMTWCGVGLSAWPARWPESMECNTCNHTECMYNIYMHVLWWSLTLLHGRYAGWVPIRTHWQHQMYLQLCQTWVQNMVCLKGHQISIVLGCMVKGTQAKSAINLTMSDMQNNTCFSIRSVRKTAAWCRLWYDTHIVIFMPIKFIKSKSNR